MNEIQFLFSFRSGVARVFRFWVILGLLALICAICELFTPKVEVSGKEGKIPLSCSELFLTSREKFPCSGCFLRSADESGFGECFRRGIDNKGALLLKTILRTN